MKCVNCGLDMELWQSSIGENDEVNLRYRCTCGYEDSKIINGRNEDRNLPTTDITDELKKSPVIRKSINRLD